MCWEREGSQWVSWPGEGLSHQQAHMQTQPPSHLLGGRPVDRYHLPPSVKEPGQIGTERRGKASDFSYNVGRAALQNMRGEGKVWVVRRGGRIRTRWAGGAAPFSTGPSLSLGVSTGRQLLTLAVGGDRTATFQGETSGWEEG